jgi:hypothetical protein
MKTKEYAELKKQVADVEIEISSLCLTLSKYPKNKIGLTLDEDKDDRYLKTKKQLNIALKRMQTLNITKIKKFKKEYEAERRQMKTKKVIPGFEDNNEKYYACTLLLNNNQRGNIVNALRYISKQMTSASRNECEQLADEVDAAGCGWLKDDLKTVRLDSTPNHLLGDES